MQGDKTLKTHENLMTRMAGTVGVDLDEAELRGDLAPEQRGEMVLACTGCSDPEGCVQWLKANASADATPGYCRNADVLLGLRT